MTRRSPGHRALVELLVLAASGGEAKHTVADGQVLLNGAVETQRRKKIVAGDVITFGEETLSISLQE